MHKVRFIDYFFFWIFTSFCEWIIHPKVLSKADIKNSCTHGCINHIKKSKKTLKKINESKSCKTWVSGMSNPNKLLRICSMFKEYLHLCENFYSLENVRLRTKKLSFRNFTFTFWQSIKKNIDLKRKINHIVF